MMVLALAVGINDATTFPNYHVFVSNQTGNTALFAVGALSIGNVTVEITDIGFSLGLFVIGSLLFGHIGDFVGRRRKIWLIVTDILQTTTMFAGAAVRHWLPNSHDSGPACAVISLLALSSRGQVAMARTVNLPQIPTAMVTSAYVDFLVDPDNSQDPQSATKPKILLRYMLALGQFYWSQRVCVCRAFAFAVSCCVLQNSCKH